MNKNQGKQVYHHGYKPVKYSDIFMLNKHGQVNENVSFLHINQSTLASRIESSHDEEIDNFIKINPDVLKSLPFPKLNLNMYKKKGQRQHDQSNNLAINNTQNLSSYYINFKKQVKLGSKKLKTNKHPSQISQFSVDNPQQQQFHLQLNNRMKQYQQMYNVQQMQMNKKSKRKIKRIKTMTNLMQENNTNNEKNEENGIQYITNNIFRKLANILCTTTSQTTHQDQQSSFIKINASSSQLKSKLKSKQEQMLQGH